MARGGQITKSLELPLVPPLRYFLGLFSTAARGPQAFLTYTPKAISLFIGAGARQRQPP